MRLSGICLSINEVLEEHFWYEDGLPIDLRSERLWCEGCCGRGCS